MNAGAQMNLDSIRDMCEDGTLPWCTDEELSLFSDGFESQLSSDHPDGRADRFEWISTEGDQA